MKKLIIQIPCYNEAETLPITLSAIPKSISGFEKIETLIIDDGSQDGTASIAVQNGATHIIENAYNIGLARSFCKGIEKALDLDADVIVNLDADNQYNAGDIEKLVSPIVSGKAKVVIGERDLNAIPYFSKTKKWLHWLGNIFVGFFISYKPKDVTSGFRAIDSSIARQIRIFSGYSYTLEMLVQLSYLHVPIHTIPIRVNPIQLRPSRLIQSNIVYISKIISGLFFAYALYNPRKFFLSLFSCSIVFNIVFYLLNTSAGLLLISAFFSVLFAIAVFFGNTLQANHLLLVKLKQKLLF